jgi:hypothetical protein
VDSSFPALTFCSVRIFVKISSFPSWSTILWWLPATTYLMCLLIHSMDCLEAVSSTRCLRTRAPFRDGQGGCIRPSFRGCVVNKPWKFLILKLLSFDSNTEQLNENNILMEGNLCEVLVCAFRSASVSRMVTIFFTSVASSLIHGIPYKVCQTSGWSFMCHFQ